jgi:hypothetical protein
MQNQSPEMPVDVPISTTDFALIDSVSSRSIRPSEEGTLAYNSPAFTISSSVCRIRFSDSDLATGGY